MKDIVLFRFLDFKAFLSSQKVLYGLRHLKAHVVPKNSKIEKQKVQDKESGVFFREYARLF